MSSSASSIASPSQDSTFAARIEDAFTSAARAASIDGSCSRLPGRSRRQPLAACVSALFAISAPATYANTITVTRCDDHNIAGDLRHAVVAAMDDDTVDMSALACPNSRISLQLGALATSHNITLLGPGED